MDSIFTDVERQLGREQRQKYLGTAKVRLQHITSHPSVSRALDPKNVERLCKVFRKEGCRRLDLRNHVTATVSRRHLNEALDSRALSTNALMANPHGQYPHLDFLPGQVHCLHGQHRLKAAEEVLDPTDQWWIVDLYLDDISLELHTALVDEYSNERTPTDGEVYWKVRQYQHEANAHFEDRWMARLSSNKAKRLRQLSSNVTVRAGFDSLLAIPALLVHGMMLGSLPRLLAINIPEEMVSALRSLRDYWSSIFKGDPTQMLKLDVHTIEKLQLLAPGLSAKDTKTVHALVQSGEVFSNFTDSERKSIGKRLKRKRAIIPTLYTFFQDMWYLEACAHGLKQLVTLGRYTASVKSAFFAIFSPTDSMTTSFPLQTSETGFRYCTVSLAEAKELAYRQLWLYAMRHYPKLGKPSEGDHLIAKQRCEDANEKCLHEMAALALKMGFNSPQIHGLVNQSPDRQIARAALLKARDPQQYQYDKRIFDSLVSQITNCFSQAIPIADKSSSVSMMEEPIPSARCGLPQRKAQQQDQRFLFLDSLHREDASTETLSTFLVRRSVYLSFFGAPSLPQLGDETAGPGPTSPALPMSPLFVPDDSPVSLGQTVIEDTTQHRELGVDEQKRRHRKEARRERRRLKREEKTRRRQEHLRRRTVRTERLSQIEQKPQSSDPPTDMDLGSDSSFGPRIGGSTSFSETSTTREQRNSAEYNFGEGAAAKEAGGEPLTLDRQTNRSTNDSDDGTSCSQISGSSLGQRPSRQEQSLEEMVEVEKRSSTHQLTPDEERDVAQGERFTGEQSGGFADAEPLTTGAVGPHRKSVQWARNAKWLPYDSSQRGRRGSNADLSTRQAQERRGLRPVTQFEFSDTQNIPPVGEDRQDQPPVETAPEQEITISQDAVAVISPTRAEPRTTGATVVRTEGTLQTRTIKWAPYDPTQRERQGMDAENKKEAQKRRRSRRVVRLELASSHDDSQTGHGQLSPEIMTSGPEAVAMQDPVPVTSSAGPAISDEATTIQQGKAAQEIRERRRHRKSSQPLGIKAVYDKKRQSRSDHARLAQSQGESGAVRDPGLNVSALDFGASAQRSQQESRRPVTQIHFQTAEQLTEQLSVGDSALEGPVPPINSSREVPEVSGEKQSMGIIGLPELLPREAQGVAVMKQDERAPSPIPQPQDLVPKRRLSKSSARKSQNKPRPVGIKKTKQVAKAKTQGPMEQNEGALIHGQSAEPGKDLDDGRERARRVVTQLDFAAWIDGGPIPHTAENVTLPREGEVTLHSASTQKSAVVQAESSTAGRRTRKILTPKIAAHSTRATQIASQKGPVTPVTIVFKARDTDGEWIKVHEVDVDGSDPTAVERLARKDARNRQATFYDKDLRMISPAQCFDAAIADGTNTVFMDFDGNLPMNEETLASIAQELNPESSRQGDKRRH